MSDLRAVDCKVGQIVECINPDDDVPSMLKLGRRYIIGSIDSPFLGVKIPESGTTCHFYASRFKLVTDPPLQPFKSSAVSRPRFGKNQSLVGPYTSEGKITINDLIQRNG